MDTNVCLTIIARGLSGSLHRDEPGLVQRDTLRGILDSLSCPAIAYYDEAIRLDPEHAKAYNNRGLTYQSLGKVEEAERDFQKAKELGYNP